MIIKKLFKDLVEVSDDFEFRLERNKEGFVLNVIGLVGGSVVSKNTIILGTEYVPTAIAKSIKFMKDMGIEEQEEAVFKIIPGNFFELVENKEEESFLSSLFDNDYDICEFEYSEEEYEDCEEKSNIRLVRASEAPKKDDALEEFAVALKKLMKSL